MSGNPNRGADGMLSRFSVDAMGRIRPLVQWMSESELNAFYKRFISLKHFKDLEVVHLERKLPGSIRLVKNPAYRCTAYPEYGAGDIENCIHLKMNADGSGNPLEILHILAHYVQPADSPWHGGAFGKIFLGMVERQYDADMRREVKDIMVELRLKTTVRSVEAREKQSQAYYDRKMKEIPEGLLDVLKDMKGLLDG